MQGGTYYLMVTQSRDTSISVKYTFRYSYPEVAESNTEESNKSSEEQSSTSNSSNTTSVSTSQSSLSSSTEVAVKKVASIKAYGLHAFLDVGPLLVVVACILPHTMEEVHGR